MAQRAPPRRGRSAGPIYVQIQGLRSRAEQCHSSMIVAANKESLGPELHVFFHVMNVGLLWESVVLSPSGPLNGFGCADGDAIHFDAVRACRRLRIESSFAAAAPGGSISAMWLSSPTRGGGLRLLPALCDDCALLAQRIVHDAVEGGPRTSLQSCWRVRASRDKSFRGRI